MVAVLALTHKRGGRCSLLMASPRSSVVRIRDSRISRRLFRLYRQFTLRPARLITTSASSNSLSQSSGSAPFHETICQGATAPLRDRTVTALPCACRCPATIRPRCPRPRELPPEGGAAAKTCAASRSRIYLQLCLSFQYRQNILHVPARCQAPPFHSSSVSSVTSVAKLLSSVKDTPERPCVRHV